MKDNTYQDNMNIIDDIINELVIIRTIEEVVEYNKAISILFLKMYPYVCEEADIVEDMFKSYAKEHNVNQWYESKPLFSIPITKI